MEAARADGLFDGEAVNGRMYTDEAVFEEEMERIFNRTWVYVAHESELESPGDYKTTRLGLQSVIVARGADDGVIRVMLNRCRHRAASVCQTPCGSANFFRCAYHGWTYNNKGELIGMPFQDGYGPDLDKRELGLAQAPRVAAYRGFVFASMNEAAPPLEEHLRHVLPYLDQTADSAPGGIALRAGAQRYAYPNNWKLQLENTIDPYHASITHQSFFDMLGKKMGKRINFKKQYEVERVNDLGGGSSIYHMDADFGIGELPFILLVFPNLGILGSQIRVIEPVSAGATKVTLYPMLGKASSDADNAARLRKHEIFYGPAGQGTADDLEVAFDRVAEGLAGAGDGARLTMRRGLHREQPDANGLACSHPSDEVPFRSLYREWRRLMTAGG
ncbi:Rieske 2Fe-2S domain-containing protein [Paenibacillus sp. IB182496]|uniref:Rieske 2Fe-2S domain-containing protein n=1 Tax=Paenibacillus sabuli TaxID=2772509 RepID=A0A927BNI2_9BACL|nr:aromatic ring-hydroxylating dioxygenase subunit alpha [Paenibacillus sabuli]MBD2843791.1 Rieske 2Fe-2S domain-containing protein [Paenibacillus sabuli]